VAGISIEAVNSTLGFERGANMYITNSIKLNSTKLRDFGPQASYTDRATAAC
jgi:hypothetical protein